MANSVSRVSRPSIKDIARAARVSHSTVSRALRGSPLVTAETARKIRSLAQKMGYRPSALARGLVTQETKTVGVVVTNVTDPFIAELVTEIEERANARGYAILLANSKEDPKRELEVVHRLYEHHVDGVFVMASRVGALYQPMLAELQVPIVLVDNHLVDRAFHSVSIDDCGGARAATKHLVELGHKRIAYIGDRHGYQADKERRRGYQLGMRDGRLRCPKRWSVCGDGKTSGGIEAMRKLLAMHTRPTAVVCYNDMTALGALHAIQQEGLRVPQDISLVGFDDIRFAAHSSPPLTTVRQPKDIMSELAVATMMELLNGGGPPATKLVPAELVIRASTAPPGSAG